MDGDSLKETLLILELHQNKQDFIKSAQRAKNRELHNILILSCLMLTFSSSRLIHLRSCAQFLQVTLLVSPL